MINNCGFRKITCSAFIAATIGISGCTQNVREQLPDAIAESVKHGSRPEQTDLAWYAPNYMPAITARYFMVTIP